VKEDYRLSKIQRLEKEVGQGSQNAQHELLELTGQKDAAQKLRKEAKRQIQEKQRIQQEDERIYAQGSVEELLNVGTEYHYGFIPVGAKFVRGKSREAAIRFYQKASEKGSVKADMALGMICSSDYGMRVAIQWFLKASEKGENRADLMLGKTYYLGLRGIPNSSTRDHKKATKHLKVAAKDHAIAKLVLGKIYYEGGNGIIADYDESVRWYSEAAEEGHCFAAYKLGAMYLEGKVVPRNFEMATKWLTKAAKGGYSKAAALLSDKHSEVDAYMWRLVAQYLGDTTLRNRDGAFELDQVRLAQQKAADFTRDIEPFKEDEELREWELE